VQVNASRSTSDAAETAASTSRTMSRAILNRQGYGSGRPVETQIGVRSSNAGEVTVAVATNPPPPTRYQHTRSPGAIRSAFRRWRVLTPCTANRRSRVRR